MCVSNQCVSLCLYWHLDVSHSWQEHGVHAVESVGRQHHSVKSRTVCNIVWAINLQLIFLGHLSAGSYLYCSNLSAYYVTRWPTFTLYTLTDCGFLAGLCFPWVTHLTVWMQVRLTGFQAGISQLKVWKPMKQHEEKASLTVLKPNSVHFQPCTYSYFHFTHGLAAFTVFFWTTS